MFGRRKREEAEAVEAAREAERRALFARLAERPEHVCPFLGLDRERTGYVDGVSDDHRCFAFGDPAVISAEQQTQVCQQRGYGNCPRYLRGVLVIPTEELEALRRPHPAAAVVPPTPVQPRRRRRAPLLLILLLLLVGGGAGAAYLLLGGLDGVATNPSPSQTPSAVATASASASAEPSTVVSPEPTATILASPTPEPTPSAGDAFAFYEVSVSPNSYTLFAFDNGAVTGTRVIGFDAFSFARVEPDLGDDGDVYWVTLDGDLTDFAYQSPTSGDFRIRAVFLNGDGDRRSAFLDADELDELPSETPSP